MSFTDFNLYPSITQTLTEKGYTVPTPIQEQAIPLALQKRDILGCAQTGTGKTLSFAIPIVQMLMKEKPLPQEKRISALVLAPTRELALQIAETIQLISRNTNIKHIVLFGGVAQQPQVNKLKAGVDILVATPGRLKDLMNQGYISLKHIKYLVLDEADRMLDMGFIREVQQIIAQVPAKRQTLFFSATMPVNILKLANELLCNPVKVEIAPVASTTGQITQYVYFSEKAIKPALLVHLLSKTEMETVIVFTQMKHMADKISRLLQKEGIQASAIHGNKSQRQREQALEQFKNKNIRVLVATDIAARGIDIDKLSHVINYDLPQTAETYVHRIGRTGRAGATGTAISICSQEEKPLLAAIQQLIKKAIPVAGNPPLSEQISLSRPVTISVRASFSNRPRQQSPAKRDYLKRRRVQAVKTGSL